MPRLGAGPLIGIPHIRASPRVACSKPATIRSSVDFPHPDAPMRQTNSPLATLRLASRNASIRSPPNSNCLVTPLSSRIGVVASDMGRAPTQEPLSKQNYQAVGDEAGNSDHNHPGNDDLGARQLSRLHDDGAKTGVDP